jgi:membrane associated rhomboid family serine protease
LAPLSHGAVLNHFSVNLLLFLLLGWPLETHLDSRLFFLFTVATAYIPTYLQIGYSAVMTGTAGTLGFSGAVYAFPPALLCIRFRETRDSRFGGMGSFALGVTIAIPLQMLGLLEQFFPSPLPAADITHGAGYLIGWAYGLLLLSGHRE